MTLGQRIQEYRKAAGLSQEALGEELGVSRQAVSKWESDGGVPELDTLIAMSRRFGVTLGALLGVEELAAADTPEPAQPAPVPLEEERVEAILRRSVEETRAQTPPARSRWKGTAAAAGVLLLCAGAVAALVWMGGRLSGMDHTIGYLQQEIYDLQSSMGEQIHGIAGQVEDILTEQNNPVDHFQWEVARYFPDVEEVRLTLSADLKTYTPETQARYRLTWEEADGSTGEAVTDWTAPPLFTACDVQVPLSTYTTAALEIREGDRTQRYDLGPLTSLDPDAFVLFGEQETAPFSVDMGGAVSVTAEHPRVRITCLSPEQVWPESAWLSVQITGQAEELYPLTLVEDSQGVWLGHTDPEVIPLTLEAGELVDVTLHMVDNWGRETTQGSSISFLARAE